ncbi:hypothetical protein [Patulibacter minatonensis]|uniref:hypothetical protein n=1 Tax=Patulibacter minatonensis TaxID=298163 RepID=UPI00047D3CD9|nr:hypothetical protein [Patulibacter minatonensis]
MSIAILAGRFPEPTHYDLRCADCGESVFHDETPPYLTADDAIVAHQEGRYGLVTDDGSWARCDSCVEKLMDNKEDPACDGSGEITWNPSSSGDPQAELSAPCRGCPNCEWPPAPTTGTKGDRS